MKTSLLMLKTDDANAKKRAGKADHVVASGLRALTKATNLIFDFKILPLKTQQKFFFFSNTPQPSRKFQSSFLPLTTFLSPLPHRNF